MGRKTVAIGDLHSGHRVGLTHPDFIARDNLGCPAGKWEAKQEELWRHYTRMIDKQKPIDILFVNGDGIEGLGKRSGGTELLTPDRNQQVEMAQAAIEYAEASIIIMTRGTPYHTGVDEDWEDTLARLVHAEKIGEQEWVDIDGVVFDLKHKPASATGTVHRGTPLTNEWLWNTIWTERKEQPNSDVILRSHCHHFFYSGDDTWLGVMMPALQGLGTKFGARQRSQTVHFGIVYFETFGEGVYTWGWDIVKGGVQSAKALKL